MLILQTHRSSSSAVQVRWQSLPNYDIRLTCCSP